MKNLKFINKKVSATLWLTKQFQFKVKIIPDNPNPETLKNNIIYVVGGIDYEKWAYLKCPCGCGDSIMLSLNKETYPSWSIFQDKFGRATIYPSIKRLNKCKSHFIIKKGKLIWTFFD